MARIAKFEEVGVERTRVHDEVDCTYSVFTAKGGQKYFQLNTYGSKTRKNPGKQSQTIQLDEGAVKQLLGILSKEFRS